MPVPPPAQAASSIAVTSGITTRPSKRYFGLQPHTRYAAATSQTKRLSEPAHEVQAKPSALTTCSISRAVWKSQPRRTPQVASFPARPG